jgi:hypothetical protein
MGIKYRHTMGGVHYPMIKCQPDISMHTILLSQYMNDPGEAHYVVLKQLIQYCSVTPDVGIYYWREHPHAVLPDAPLPQLHANNHILQETRPTNSTQLMAYVDSDWATNTKKGHIDDGYGPHVCWRGYCI